MIFERRESSATADGLYLTFNVVGGESHIWRMAVLASCTIFGRLFENKTIPVHITVMQEGNSRLGREITLCKPDSDGAASACRMVDIESCSVLT